MSKEIKKTFQVRMTQKEIDFIKERAKLSYINPNEYIMLLALGEAEIMEEDFYGEE